MLEVVGACARGVEWREKGQTTMKESRNTRKSRLYRAKLGKEGLAPLGSSVALTPEERAKASWFIRELVAARKIGEKS